MQNNVFCSLCYSKVPFASRVEDESLTQQQKFEDRLRSVEDKVTEAVKTGS